MLVQLWSAGIVWNKWNFLKAYLSDHQQFVSIDGCSSSLLPVTSGVPQGSILSPMLFLVYIISLPDVRWSATCLMFADDTKCWQKFLLFLAVTSSKMTNNLLTWSHLSKLSFNLPKTVMLCFPSRSTNIINATYFIGSWPIQSVSTCKDLGVTISSNLPWSQHYSIIISRAYCLLDLICCILNLSVSARAKKLLYLSLVRSWLTYCCCGSWESSKNGHQIYLINNPSLDCKARLAKLGVPPLISFFEYVDFYFLVTCLKDPDSKFPVSQYILFSSFNTRSHTSSKLVVNKVKSNPSRHFYFNRVTWLWNFLRPIDLNLSLSSITDNLKRLFWKHFQENFSSSNYCSFCILCPCNNCWSIPSSSSF